MLSEVQKLRELIDQSESIILINLDSQRNVMLRLSLQLEMGMFSAAVSGLIGVAFGMNLDSSLEEVSTLDTHTHAHTHTLRTEPLLILGGNWAHVGFVWAALEKTAAFPWQKLG